MNDLRLLSLYLVSLYPGHRIVNGYSNWGDFLVTLMFKSLFFFCKMYHNFYVDFLLNP